MTSSAALGSAVPFSTSTGLLERAKAHDPDGWRRLTSLYGPAVYRWSRRCGLQASDAADVVQEVFAAVWRNIGTFRRERPHDSFRGWLWTITRNKIRDHFRGLAARPAATGGSEARQHLEELPELPDALGGDEPGTGTSTILVHQTLELVRAEFEPKTWQAFWQTAVEARNPAEVARDLRMTVGAVYVAKSRVLRRIREQLSGLID